MPIETQADGTIVTSASGSEGDKITLPEGVEITTSNTSQLTVKTEGDAKADPEVKPEDKPEVDPDAQLEQDVQGIIKAEEDLKGDLKSKGVDFGTLEAEFETNGQLSEASYLALEKAGYPRSAVDAYTTGLMAKADQFVSRVTDLVGGPEELKAVTTFIGSQGDAYIKAYNEALEKGSIKQLELVLKGAKADMVAKFGSRNDTVLGGDHKATSVGFANQAEAVKAVNDPRYARDAAYTKEVQAKIAKTSGLFA